MTSFNAMNRKRRADAKKAESTPPVPGGEEPLRGAVDRHAVRNLRQHEIDTARWLADLGHDVRFIPADSLGKTADIEINSQRWEIKSPTSSNRNTLVRRLGRGAAQSGRVVFDISRTEISIDEASCTAGEALRRYPELSVVWIVGRTTDRGPLDIRIGR